MRKILGLLLIGVLFSNAFFTLALVKPLAVDEAVITAATATLSNPRRSYLSTVSSTLPANSGVIGVAAGSYQESTVAGLFPGDAVAIGPNGNEVVASIPSTTGSDFIITGGLDVGASSGTDIIATQSGTVSLVFTTGTSIPNGGYVEVVIPDPASNGNDKKPDYNATLANNGFDLNGLDASANVSHLSVSGAGCTWSSTYGAAAEIMTAGSGNGHTYKNFTTTGCSAGTITVTIGDSTVPLINPARVNNTLGVADTYQFTINTKNAAGTVIETRDVAVALTEGVLVSASVDETLSFTVAGHTGAACGATSSVTTTASTVPWGVLSTTYASGTHNASQQLTLSTNSTSGYKVYAQENDQMGKDGNTCTGTAPSAGEYTFTAGKCIRDTVGSGTSSHIVETDWDFAGDGTMDSYGFGYSLQNVTSTPALFDYNGPSDNKYFMVKQFADMTYAPDAQEIPTASGAELMTKATGPIVSDSVYVCFRINIPADQPAGYYYNVLRYTAVPIF